MQYVFVSDLAWLKYLFGDGICINNYRTKVSENFCNCGFTASNSTRESYVHVPTLIAGLQFNSDSNRKSDCQPNDSRLI